MCILWAQKEALIGSRTLGPEPFVTSMEYDSR